MDLRNAHPCYVFCGVIGGPRRLHPSKLHPRCSLASAHLWPDRAVARKPNPLTNSAPRNVALVMCVNMKPAPRRRVGRMTLWCPAKGPRGGARVLMHTGAGPKPNAEQPRMCRPHMSGISDIPQDTRHQRHRPQVNFPKQPRGTCKRGSTCHQLSPDPSGLETRERLTAKAVRRTDHMSQSSADP